MPGFHDGFDPMGLVIDWLDACKERRLSSLVDLYDESATLDCCCENAARTPDLEAYWGPKLAHAVIGAFEVDALFPETDGVCLDYRAFDERRCEYISSSLTREKFGTTPAHR